MSAQPKAYRFATQAQWNTGLARRLEWAGDGLQVTAALATHAQRVGPDARTGPLVAAPDGALYWVEYPQTLRWLDRHQDQAGALEAAPEIADAPRLVAGSRWLWTHRAERAELYRFALDTLTGPETFRLRDLLAVESRCAELEVVDIAGDGCDGLWLLLLDSSRPLQLVHVSARGVVRSSGDLPPCNGVPTAIAALTQEIAVLHGDTQLLLFVRKRDLSSTAQIALTTLGADFQHTCLGGDGIGEVTVGGTVAGPCGRTTQLCVLQRTASGVDCAERRTLPAGGVPGARAVAHRRDELWVSSARGVWRFGPATAANPDEPQALFLTPVLTSPQSDSGSGWLRADLEVDLPLGARVTLGYASTSDQKVRDAIVAIASRSELAAEQRIAQINEKLNGSLTSRAIEFIGGANGSAPQAVSIPISRPMGNAPGNNTDLWMWVLVGVTSAAAGPLPRLRHLRVLYPFASLMEHLPAVFRGEGQVSGFMLDLVGILEATVQRLDTEIGGLARALDPEHAPANWLDELAGWTGLPWDSALGTQQKRAILQAAPQLLSSRGTRTALRTFLACLFPGRCIEIFDQAADVQPARVGGAACTGASLPAILAGWPRGLAVLGDKAVLNGARLACATPDEVPDAAPPSVLRIEITATAGEQSATPLATVASLLAAVVPAECQLHLRWRLGSAVGPQVEADGTLVLDGPRPRRLSESFELGYAVLGGHDRATLDVAGLSTDERLQ